MKTVMFLSNFTVGLLIFNAIGAFASGGLLMFKPDGSGLGLPLALLKTSPFEDYFIPGLVLLIVNGVFSLVGAYFVFKNHYLRAIAMIILGILMIGWISFEVYWIGYESWIQPAFFTVGFVEIAIGFSFHYLGKDKQNIIDDQHKPHVH